MSFGRQRCQTTSSGLRATRENEGVGLVHSLVVEAPMSAAQIAESSGG